MLTVKKLQKIVGQLLTNELNVNFLTSCIRFAFFNSNLQSSGTSTHCTAYHHSGLMETKLY